MAGKVTRDHHSLRRNLKLNGKYVSNDGGDEGLSVSDAGAVSTSGALTVGGDLTVSGTTTTLNTQTIEVEDNILQLNTTQASPDTATAATSGISIYRGNGVTQASLIFDDADDTWDLTNNIAVAGNIDLEGDIDVNGTANLDIVDIDGAVNMAADLTSTADIIIDADDKALVLGDDQDASIFSNAAGEIFFVRGQDYSPAAGDVEGWIAMTLGNSSDTYLSVLGGEGGSSHIILHSDGGDDDADKWKLTVADGGAFTMNYATTGSYVDHFNMSSAGAVFNESGAAALDFRVESDGEDEAIFLDSSANTLYINKGETSFDVKISSDNDEALRVDAAGVVLNEDGHATNDFRVESDSNTHMLFVDSGNNKIGIGTAAPISTLNLSVSDSGANYVYFQNSTTGATTGDGFIVGLNADESATLWQLENDHMSFGTNDTERMRITSAGNVGINNASPAYRLDVKESAESHVARLWNDGDDQNRDVLLLQGGADASSGNTRYISFADGDGTEFAWIQGAASSGDHGLAINTSAADATNFVIDESGNVGIGTDTPASDFGFTPLLHLKKDGDIALVLDNATEKFEFCMNNDTDVLRIGAGSLNNILCLDASSGNVGIGTNAPTSPLDIVKSVSGFDVDGHLAIQNTNGSNGDYAGIGFSSESNTGDGNIKSWFGIVRVDGWGENDFVFLQDTANDDYAVGSSEEVMRITSDGKVGIGTASPTNLLNLVTDTDDTNLVLDTHHNTDSAHANLIFRKSGGSEASPTTVADNEILGDIEWHAYDGDSYGQSAIIRCEIDGTPGDSDVPGALLFLTTPDGAQGSEERMRINNEGAVYSNTTAHWSLYPSTGTSFCTYGFTNDQNTGMYRVGADQLGFATGAGARLILDDNSRISLSNNDSGTSNTIFGKSAGASLDAGSNYNVFIGEAVSDASMNDAVSNVGVGYSALSALTTGDDNIAIGSGAMATTTTNSKNIAIGYEAAANLVAGTDGCVAIGYQALDAAVDGAHYTIAIGQSALGALTSGAGNVAIGYQALDAEDAGSCSTAVGYQALSAQNNDTGYNTAVGWTAGDLIVAGSANTLIGAEAGTTGTGDLTSGIQNTLIGQATSAGASGATNRTVIGRGATGVADNSVTLGNSSVTAVYTYGKYHEYNSTAGEVEFIVMDMTNTSSSNGDCTATISAYGDRLNGGGRRQMGAIKFDKELQWQASPPGSNDASIRFYGQESETLTEQFHIASNGDLTARDTSIGSISDSRLKENVEDYIGCLNIVKELRPVTFNYINPSQHQDGKRRGFLAQEIKEVDDYWVGEKEIEEFLEDGLEEQKDKDGKITQEAKARSKNPDFDLCKDTDHISLTSKLNAKDAMYVGAIKELLAKVETLESKVAALEG